MFYSEKMWFDIRKNTNILRAKLIQSDFIVQCTGLKPLFDHSCSI